MKRKLSKERFEHTLGVAEVAGDLAKKYGGSWKKARLAGLLHDCAKGLGLDRLIELARMSSFSVDEYEMNLPPLLHAPAGAFLARQEFGVNDQEILEAIRHHTVGSPDLSTTGLIIFVADFIEPNRQFPGVEKLRKEVDKSLIHGVIAACNQSLEYNIKKGRIIHPNTLLLRNECLRRIQ
ncbi:bis(5'-nucleosyl)-tetraphosphatase (symmetrical) YqeK [Halothermothrix orenii]|uniref:bis(5'-nucleosyl)-tetraphosphatase (symmetrical) YqeK n=1 Tax=Halothermothrix orenii TaxID=31909 RepID=UPI0014387EAD|nr:bis(5'-nucleosyl)-tetraphosphatase (symmetrical) YqeK [Halothermothrix orenii]